MVSLGFRSLQYLCWGLLLGGDCCCWVEWVCCRGHERKKNRGPTQEAAAHNNTRLRVGPLPADDLEELHLLLLAGEEGFDLWDALLVDLLALGGEAEERVQRSEFAGFEVLAAHAEGVEGAVVRCR